MIVVESHIPPTTVEFVEFFWIQSSTQARNWADSTHFNSQIFHLRGIKVVMANSIWLGIDTDLTPGRTFARQFAGGHFQGECVGENRHFDMLLPWNLRMSCGSSLHILVAVYFPVKQQKSWSRLSDLHRFASLCPRFRHLHPGPHLRMFYCYIIWLVVWLPSILFSH